MVQVRKLIAVELIYLGPKIVFAEYGFAVLVGTAIGILSLRVGLLRTHLLWQVLLGIYLLFLALTYAVLLWLAIAMAHRGDACEEIADELPRRTCYVPKVPQAIALDSRSSRRTAGRTPATLTRYPIASTGAISDPSCLSAPSRQER